MIHIPEQMKKERLPLRKLLGKLDLPGFAVFGPTAIMFFLALEYGGNQYRWNSPTVIGLFVGAGVALILFLVVEWRAGDEAMLPISMIRRRIVWSSCLALLF